VRAILTAATLVSVTSPALAAKTAHATCYDLQGRTASGTWVNKRTAAHNFLVPGTKIRIVGHQAGPGGVRKYIIRDTGPALSDGHFDLWAESGCLRFGRRLIRWKIGWAR
jgi:3D (Asp-Asp-Asp) domain-containing protein